jgi:serine/threonine protein kinase
MVEQPHDDRCSFSRDLGALLRGQLPRDQEQCLRKHLRHCDACLSRLDVLSEDPELSDLLEEADSEWLGTLDDGTPQRATTGGFNVGRVIANGEQGVVFLGFTATRNDPVVIKVAKTPAARCRWRLEQEASILERLTHQGIPRILGRGWADTDRGRRYFLAIEYVPGTTITEHLRNRAADCLTKVELFLRVCDAVNVAHMHGVVHRDLKPENILVRPDGTPVVLDFDVAKDLQADGREAHRQTAAGQLIGTLQYMSPEQAKGDARAVDTRTDVFTLGLILFELLTWHRPHRLANADLTEAVRIITHERAPRLGQYLRGVPVSIERVVAKALSLRKEQRYVDAGQLARDLRAALTDIGGTQPAKRPPTRWRRPVSRATTVAGALLGIALGLLLRSVGPLWRADSTILTPAHSYAARLP